MTDIKLLPLPEPDNDVAVDGEGNETFFEFFTDEQMHDYARANVAHATAAKDAEIEALRALMGGVEVQRDANWQAYTAEKARAERLAEALRELKDLMLGQVKWEPCDCGCPQQRTPDGPHSVTWLRAVQQVEIAISKAEGKE